MFNSKYQDAKFVKSFYVEHIIQSFVNQCQKEKKSLLNEIIIGLRQLGYYNSIFFFIKKF